MFVKRKGSSLKQLAYAKRLLGAQGTTKKDIALDVGYSPTTANSIKSHIEDKPGFNNAMAALALESNNLALAAMHEFKARGFEDFSNKDLIGALNAIGSAWARFNVVKPSKSDNPNANKLRTVILQQVENQTISGTTETPTVSNVVSKPTLETVEVADVEDPLDF